MLRLPPPASPLRSVFDVAHLVAAAAKPADLPTFKAAVHGARNHLAIDTAARSVHMLCLRADGALWLIEVTRKTWRKRWAFGVL
jgi:hypothetical protein